MTAQHVHFEHTFALPVQCAFAYLSEHEHLEVLFGAAIKRLRSGRTHRNGVGSMRRVGPPGPLGFVETVTEFVPDELIVYRITRGGPLKDHSGTMRFSATADGGTHLEYDIRMSSHLPGAAGLVKRMLERTVPAGLARAETDASAAGLNGTLVAR